MEGLLKEINSPDDLKKVPQKQLRKLAHEIRHFLIHSISQTGGHLSANLGAVELSIALHYVFNSPEDKLIWDVGHQAYIHKLLTGRRGEFDRLRMEDGLSGFPKTSESAHDIFNVGHSSTSISAGYGIAKARDIVGDDYSVISIIGDGSLTGGMAFEALNNVGRSKSKMIVILNDNQMSISENVGGLTKYLCDIRTEPTYLNVKEDIENMLKRIPGIGSGIVQSVKNAKESIRYLLVPGVLFEELGFNYLGPIDGHDIQALITAFHSAKKVKGPVFIHVKTQKGKGYPPAEKQPCKYHSVPRFDVKSGRLNKTKEVTYSGVFGNTMMELASKHEDLVAITAAMPEGTGLHGFSKAYPDRFFDVGIAEQHAVTFAAGLAISGLKPVVAIYSSFLQRAYDQIIHDVCIQNLPVVFAIDRGGIVGADGETHQGVFDISYLSHVPNLTVLAPKNAVEFKKMMTFAVEHNRPVAIRYPRGKVSSCFSHMMEPIEYGKAEKIYDGHDIAIVAYGAMNDLAVEVVDRLNKKGYSPTVINGRFASPIDHELYNEIANNHRILITLEENVQTGGFGMKVINHLVEQGKCPEHVKAFALPDAYIQHGDRESMLGKFSLNADSIIEYIESKLI
ncbi:1-deoxy-D-xylulose-5-phosphate synthase [Vallitalea okinawensis]|uniref:1-deoxy-D-xylulose-5-phosphate synthase n=1 Tax=Vallitalea okinawensis TaxID=2078660 RepID=UPI000CFB5A58|nr:1-deoxy-D-xylulose-5-phosphate synthase [Vallitalea okinawensis]